MLKYEKNFKKLRLDLGGRVKCSRLQRLGFPGSRTPKVKTSKRELEICDWYIKEFLAKIQTWEFFDMVESKKMGETSKRKFPETEKSRGLKTRTRYVENLIYHCSWESRLLVPSHISIMEDNTSLL